MTTKYIPALPGDCALEEIADQSLNIMFRNSAVIDYQDRVYLVCGGQKTRKFQYYRALMIDAWHEPYAGEFFTSRPRTYLP